ncbi:hypothetical protein COCNU_scaffold000648G000010 [Cocos nucifera]|nr:hypothetical protein [Cocos nucifera]
MKVGASSSMAFAITATASKITVSAEVLPTVESDHQMLAHIKRAHRLEVEAEKVQEDLRAEGVLKKKEFVLAELKAALALEEERKKEAEIKVIELEARMAKSISEVMIRAVEEFKTSFKMMKLNVEFGQQAFIKGFELYEG